MDEIAERGGSLIGSPTWQCLHIFVGERNADLPFLDHTVVDESKRAGKQRWRSLGEEKVVVGEEVLLYLHALWVHFWLREVFPIETALVTGKWPRLTMEQTKWRSTLTEFYQG